MAGLIFTAIAGCEADCVAYQGKTLAFNYTYGGSSPIDVTGYSARLVIKKNYRSQESLTEFTVGNGRVSIGTDDGIIAFSMTAADSAALPAPFEGVYEVELTSPSGEVICGLRGKIKIIPEVAT